MRRFYQDSWFGIDFSSFADTSFFHLADAAFYEQFYAALFRKYASWDALPQNWRSGKTIQARRLASMAGEMRASFPAEREKSPLRVFSVGGGLGFIEHVFLQELPETELHISEPSPVGMDWIRACIPPERIYIGAGASALPQNARFDMIYLSAVDYFLQRSDFTALLRELRPHLMMGGRLVCLSASLQENTGFRSAFACACKTLLLAMLHFAGIRKSQFWGWLRTREEYLEVMHEAGYEDIREGRLDDDAKTFWVSAR